MTADVSPLSGREPRPRPWPEAPGEAAAHPELPELLGRSPAMRALGRRVEALAPLATTVLVSGETGTGKGVVARGLHRLSRRRGPFVHVDCGALAPTMIESELFGHERGAFTGAVGTRAGRFEAAEGGTIFLDEIGELDPGLQTRFLRVLEDRCFERVGGTRPRPMRARIVAATNRELSAEVARRRFRQDLLYRLSVVHLRIPPLRERRTDVPLLVAAGLARIAARLGVRAPRLAPGFAERLMAHDWPGNVRELVNLLERALVEPGLERLDAAAAERLLAEALPAPPGWERPMDGPPAQEARGRPQRAPDGRDERTRIASELVAAGGNVSRAARRLSLARSTLRYRIRRYGLTALIPRD